MFECGDDKERGISFEFKVLIGRIENGLIFLKRVGWGEVLKVGILVIVVIKLILNLKILMNFRNYIRIFN